MVEVKCKECKATGMTFKNLSEKDFPDGWKCEDCSKAPVKKAKPVAVAEKLPEQTNKASPEKDISKVKVEEVLKEEIKADEINNPIKEEPKVTFLDPPYSIEASKPVKKKKAKKVKVEEPKSE